MTTGSHLYQPLGCLLASVLLVSCLCPSLCQFPAVGQRPGPSGGDSVTQAGDFNPALMNPAFHPAQLESTEARLEELQRFMGENRELFKRLNNFVRVGRGGGGGAFVRIGKSSDDLAGDGVPYGLQSPVQESYSYPNKRYMHRFIRIGRGMGDNGEDDEILEGEDYLRDRDDSFDRFRKAPSSFVRIGKAPNKFLRIGKSPSSFVRIGKAPNKFLRIGRAPNKFVRIGKSPSSFVRIGRMFSDTPQIYNDKRAPSFVRIGRSTNQVNTPMENPAAAAKRSSSFVRIGKSLSALANQAKRSSSFVRIGKSMGDKNVQDDNNLKRGFVRIGKSSLLDKDAAAETMKRTSSFVRIGKSSQLLDSEGAPATEKRAGNFLRIGRLSSPDTKASSKRGFVRIGRKDGSPQNDKADSTIPSSDESPEDAAGDRGPINVATRGAAFVRIGKIPSSAFVRIGKNADVMMEEEPARVYSFNRGSRGGHSSFVRIG